MSPKVEEALDKSEEVEEKLELAVGGGEWFPTVQKTISILAKLHASLPVVLFSDLVCEF